MILLSLLIVRLPAKVISLWQVYLAVNFDNAILIGIVDVINNNELGCWRGRRGLLLRVGVGVGVEAGADSVLLFLQLTRGMSSSLLEWYLPFALSFFLTPGVRKEEVASRSTGVNIVDRFDRSQFHFLACGQIQKESLAIQSKVVVPRRHTRDVRRELWGGCIGDRRRCRRSVTIIVALRHCRLMHCVGRAHVRTLR
jgi:hypothetical protein